MWVVIISRTGSRPAEVVMALAGVPEDAPLDVHINSYGGIATEGAAVYAILIARPGHHQHRGGGIAASAALAHRHGGETVTNVRRAVMMIHDPATFAFGPARTC